ncbi:MAG: hypothetical protein AAFU85_23015, partial [Planctomycetota bacterium]
RIGEEDDRSVSHQTVRTTLMGDGAVIFFTDSIDAGDARNPMVWHLGAGATNNVPGAQSPYGLWGALGTRASRETIDAELNQ